MWVKFIKFFQKKFRKSRGIFLKQTYPKINTYKILDVGGSQSFWNEINILSNYKNLTILNIKEYQNEYENKDKINTVIYDGKTIPFKNQSFDLIICNSVIEHVSISHRKLFCKELMRVGKNYFLQTPSFYFPFEPHFVMPFLHWLPKNVGFLFAHLSPWRILSNPDKYLIKDYFYNTNLLKEAELKEYFKNSRIFKEKLFLMTKSYYVIGNSK